MAAAKGAGPEQDAPQKVSHSRLSSCQDDAIRTTVETWADAVGALA